MSIRNQIKKKGRPKSTIDSLNREKILNAATHAFLNEKQGVSIRRLAVSLKVDPMAIYYYFPSKDNLLEEICMSFVNSIYRPKISKNWRLEVKRLALSYIKILSDSPSLIETLISLGGKTKGPSAFFEKQFAIATSLHLSKAQLQSATHLLADFLHGFALGFKYVSPTKKDNYLKDLESSLNLYFLALETLIKN